MFKKAVWTATVLSGGLVLSPLADAQQTPRPDNPAPARAAQEKTRPARRGAEKSAPERGSDTREAAKPRETAKDTQDRAKDTRNTTKDRTKDARDTAKDTAKDTERDTRDRAKDTAKDARDDANDRRDEAKDRTKDRRDDAKDTAEDRRDDAKNRRDDARDVAKDRRDDKSSDQQSRKFNVDNVKADDFGLAFKESTDNGITISTVQDSGPIYQAGFRRGDRIVSVNGERIGRQRDFFRYLFADDIRDDRVKVIVIRDDVEEIVYVQPAVIIREYETVVVDDRNPVRDFGLVLDDRYDDRLVVRKVIADSPADRARVREGDEVLSVNERSVEKPMELARMLEKFDGEMIELEVRRERESKIIEVEFVR